MKIIADENIAYAIEAFSAFGEVYLKKGRSITPCDLQDADVLLVRSVTQVNQSLLANTPVKFVGTATIGIDHIDTDYLQEKNITFTSCAGCNANAVAEYVITALFHQHPLSYWQTKTVAIIGYGNVGQSVARWLDALKINYIINDPPLEYSGRYENIHYVNLETALQADVISLHVPLVEGGSWPTHHLLNAANISLINNNATLLNTCRGEVVNNKELLKVVKERNINLLFDVWENEPEPLVALIELAKVATPHIAGYSLAGKVNGTKILHKALSEYVDKSVDWNIVLPESSLDLSQTDSGKIEQLFSQNYSIDDDTKNLQQIGKVPNRAEYFDSLRKNYSLRNELGLKVLENLKA